jgi:hypothetical protein
MYKGTRRLYSFLLSVAVLLISIASPPQAEARHNKYHGNHHGYYKTKNNNYHHAYNKQYRNGSQYRKTNRQAIKSQKRAWKKSSVNYQRNAKQVRRDYRRSH